MSQPSFIYAPSYQTISGDEKAVQDVARTWPTTRPGSALHSIRGFLFFFCRLWFARPRRPSVMIMNSLQCSPKKEDSR